MRFINTNFVLLLCTLVFISGCSSLEKTTNNNLATTTASSPIKTKVLDPKLPPSENFDLSTWYLSVPDNNNGRATSVKEGPLNEGYQNKKYFYTGKDGGMVFKCPIKGTTTSSNTNYTRVELREMLRAGNTSIKTKGVNKNNWVLGSSPKKNIKQAGGYDCMMTATLAVNHVTTTGDKSQVGRVVIGQVHAAKNEPVRIYYRKNPGNNLGRIYFAHETNPPKGSKNRRENIYFEIMGSRNANAPNPVDGIALNEKFSYNIKILKNEMWVTIIRKGKKDIVQHVDMRKSGYDSKEEYFYFKAGAYNQNRTGKPDDYVQVTFYNLEALHSN